MKTFVIIIILLISNKLWSQEVKTGRMPQIGDLAPSFVSESTMGTIHFPQDFGRNWKIIFSHPRDFTPVCSTEILELAHAASEFDKLGAKLIVLSTDRLESHFSWKAALEEINFKGLGLKRIDFPLVDDQHYLVSALYGMHHPNAKKGTNIRGVFFIDRENVIRAFFYYPTEIGRNTDEIIRTLQALQKTDDNPDILTPANWQPGEPVLVAHPNSLMQDNMKQPETVYFQYSWFLIYFKDTL